MQSEWSVRVGDAVLFEAHVREDGWQHPRYDLGVGFFVTGGRSVTATDTFQG